MAITSSAKKAHRVSLRKHVFNVRRKKALGNTTKDIRVVLAEGKVAEAEKMLPAAYQAIDKALKSGVLKANTAARKKARLVGAIRRAAAK